MKKVFALMSIVAMFSLVACGPSAEEKRKKAEQDSIAAQHTKDSLEAEQKRLDDEMKSQQDTMTNDTTNATTAGTTTGTTEATTK